MELRGLVASQVCMAKLPWKEPGKAVFGDQSGGREVAGQQSPDGSCDHPLQLHSSSPTLSPCSPSQPAAAFTCSRQCLLLEGRRRLFQATHCLLPRRRGRNGALALGMTFLAQPPLTPSWYRPLLVQLARFGWGAINSANGDSCKVAATCWLGPWPPLSFCLFCCFGGRGSDSVSWF